ncbi:MAG TPA: hypothetical protein VLK84_03205 [Longimicrobium sp.]|nr:hypothetical protein [Longimicrobium sp.]
MGPMLRWFVFTVAMGLLPFSFSALLQTLRGIAPERWQNSPELLFFSVILCAAQLGGIFDTLSHGPPLGRWRKTMLSCAFGIFLLAAIVSAGLYGVYVDHERGVRMCQAASTSFTSAAPLNAGHCNEWLDFQTNLYRFCIVIAVIVGSFGMVTEWIRTRRKL